MNRERFEELRLVENPFPLTSILSLGERRNHLAPWGQIVSVGCLDRKPRQGWPVYSTPTPPHTFVLSNPVGVTCLTGRALFLASNVSLNIPGGSP